MAQLDARPTGDQEVSGLNPTGLATFFREDFDLELFSTVIFSFFPDSRRAVVSFLARECAQYG